IAGARASNRLWVAPFRPSSSDVGTVHSDLSTRSGGADILSARPAGRTFRLPANLLRTDTESAACGPSRADVGAPSRVSHVRQARYLQLTWIGFERLFCSLPSVTLLSGSTITTSLWLPFFNVTSSK